MTTAGIQIFNDSDVLQIDQNFHTMLLTQKGTVTLTSDTTTFAPGTVYTATISYTGTSPVLAWNGPASVCLYRVDNTGTSWTFYLVANGAASITMNYFIFDDSKVVGTPTDHFGLEIFDASGNLVFHSSFKPLRVVGAMTIADPTQTVGTEMPITTTTFTTTTGITYAVVQSNLFYRSEKYLSARSHGTLTGGQVWYDNRMIRGTASADNSSSPSSVGGAAAQMFIFFGGGNAGGGDSFINQFGQLAWLVIDVTNY